MAPRVEARDLWKTYRGGVEAVRGVSFDAGPGVTVLMGPNGSGKTTTLSMVAGALKPTRGRVLVSGYDVWGDGWVEARERLGFAPQNMPFRERLTAVENLVWYGLIRGLGLREARARARRLLDLVGLSDAANRRVEALSGGMRRRLAIAAAFMGDPEVLVLDEPTSGLDPGARLELWRLLQSLAGDRVLLVSTHIPEEAEEHADTVLVFHRGRIVAQGAPGELIKRYAPKARVVVRGRLPGEPSRVPGAHPSRVGVEEHVYASDDPDHVLPRLLEDLVARGGRVEAVEVRKPGLGEVYLSLTGEALWGGGGG